MIISKLKTTEIIDQINTYSKNVKMRSTYVTARKYLWPNVSVFEYTLKILSYMT